MLKPGRHHKNRLFQMSFHMHCYAHFRLHINRWRQYPTFIRVMPCSCAILFSRQCHGRPLNLSQSPRGHVITQLIKFHNNKYNWSKMQRSAHLFVSKSQTINFKKKMSQTISRIRSIDIPLTQSRRIYDLSLDLLPVSHISHPDPQHIARVASRIGISI